MALKILILQKMMLPSLKIGAPLCSIPVIRCSSEYSAFKNRNKLDNNLKKNILNDSFTPPIVIFKRFLHPMYDNILMKPNKQAEEESALASDSENENDEDDESKMDALLDSKIKLSANEWNDLKVQLSQDQRYSKLPSFDGIIMKQCLRQNNYWLAASYIEYLSSQGKEPNLLALGCYLQLCGQNVEECGEDKVLDVYKQLCDKVKAFDVTLSEHAVIALTRTSEWKQAFKHLKIIRKLCNVSPKVYSSLIAACFNNEEYDTGWHLLEAMRKEEKEPLDHAYLSWLKQCESGEDYKSMARLLFHKFAEHDLYPKVPVIKEIKKLFEEKCGWSGMYMKVFNSGECPACGQQLENLEVNGENFARLKEEFASRILHGTDIFKATSPEEWARFVEFVEKEGPFTTVVDGLNVAYTVGKRSPQVRMKRVREAVQKLKVANRKGRIMVIGRKHMIEWSPRDLEAIERRAVVFTLDNISKDDGFMLYAALHSGLGTQFVTSDMLRDHIHRLGDPTLKETFRHWQRGHQILAVQTPVGVQLMPPPSFRTAAQNHGTEGWHIPYNDGSSRESYQVPYTWLCLQSKPHQQGIISSKNVSQEPSEYSPTDASLHYLSNPKNFVIDPDNPETDFITLTGKLLGSQKSETKPMNIQYGKFNSKHRDDRNSSRNYNNYNSPSGTQPKIMAAKNKLKEDMMKIVNRGKGSQRYTSATSVRSTTSDGFESKGFLNKYDLKSNKRITFKDIFSETKK